MNNEHYDLIIVGGGPAGVAGAVYAARKQLSTLLITESFGGQSIVSDGIKNWIGDITVSGDELAKRLEAHARDYEGEYLTILAERATASTVSDEQVLVSTERGTVTADALLIASGSARRKLSVPGAETFENKGVTYCASCDGPLFSGMPVVVVGGGNAGFESAAQLLAYAEHVTLLHRSSQFKADSTTVEKVLSHDNMTAHLNTEPIEIVGEQFVSSVRARNKETGEEFDIPANGVFVEIGALPATKWVDAGVERDSIGRLTVNPLTQQSSHPRVWAAGDCTDGLFHQNNIAAGDAVKALEHIYLTLKAK